MASPRATLLTRSGCELAEMIRHGTLRSIDVVEAHIARIQEVNPSINAVVAERFDAAREEARRADDQTDNCSPSDLPPFHGVPCTIKECFAMEGMPNASGLVSRQHVRPRSDATAVARMRAAGAIPMGVTNTSELCMWMESSNRLYGRTSNPYDPTRIVGGSSGGEGAIIGAGASPFGLGSDIGGSIRMPAFFNGVFGHKPTGGLVPGTGQHPIAENAALVYLTTGPLARRAEDLMPLLRILAGPDGLDSGVRPMKLGDPNEVDVGQLRVVSVEQNGIRSVHTDLLEAQRRAGESLVALGAQLESTVIEGFKRSFQLWSVMLNAAGGTPFRTLLGRGEPLDMRRALVRYLTARSEHTLPALALALTEELPFVKPKDPSAIVAEGHALRDEISALLGADGVMLYPSYTRPAPRHRTPLLTPVDFVFTAIINVLELPATQVPLGLNDEGLPVGVQVVGAPGQDHLTIAVAQALEQQLGGWVAPWEA